MICSLVEDTLTLNIIKATECSLKDRRFVLIMCGVDLSKNSGLEEIT